jgi:hypothetical protein
VLRKYKKKPKKMNTPVIHEFTFRAWSRRQAERFISHIPDLLVSDVQIKKWSDSSGDVTVILQVQADLTQLTTILSGLPDVGIISRTLASVNGNSVRH